MIKLTYFIKQLE